MDMKEIEKLMKRRLEGECGAELEIIENCGGYSRPTKFFGWFVRPLSSKPTEELSWFTITSPNETIHCVVDFHRLLVVAKI